MSAGAGGGPAVGTSSPYPAGVRWPAQPSPMPCPPAAGVPCPARLPQPCSVWHLVSHYLDIASVPRRSFFELLACLSPHELEREKLLYFSSPQGQEELYAYCNRPRRTVLEVRAAVGRRAGPGLRATASRGPCRLKPTRGCVCPGAVRLPAHGRSPPRRLSAGPHPPDPPSGLLHRLLSAGEGGAQSWSQGRCVGRRQAYRWGGGPRSSTSTHIWAQPSGEWVRLEARADRGQESPVEPDSHRPIPQAHPSRLQILVAVVQYQTRLKEPRRGLCSSWLASLDPGQGDPCFLEGRVEDWARGLCSPLSTTASPRLGRWSSAPLHASFFLR